MLCKLEYMTGILLRAPAEFFSGIHDPIATMLLVNGHCEQSHTIPIVFNQNGSNGFIAAATTRSGCRRMRGELRLGTLRQD